MMRMIAVLNFVAWYALLFGGPEDVPIALAAAGLLAVIAWLSLVGGAPSRDRREELLRGTDDGE